MKNIVLALILAFSFEAFAAKKKSKTPEEDGGCPAYGCNSGGSGSTGETYEGGAGETYEGGDRDGGRRGGAYDEGDGGSGGSFIGEIFIVNPENGMVIQSGRSYCHPDPQTGEIKCEPPVENY